MSCIPKRRYSQHFPTISLLDKRKKRGGILDSLLINTILNALLFERDSWRVVCEDNGCAFRMLDERVREFQDPADADKITRIQRDLEDTKEVLVSFYLFII